MLMNVSMVVNVLEENFCRTIKQIFEAQHRLKENIHIIKKQSKVVPFQASFLEIYNEEIRDLLAVEKDLKYEVRSSRRNGDSLI